MVLVDENVRAKKNDTDLDILVYDNVLYLPEESIILQRLARYVQRKIISVNNNLDRRH